MTDDDLTVIATYLKSFPAPKGAGESSQGGTQTSSNVESAIYHDACSACHQENGEGMAGLFPSLKGDAVAQSAKPTTVIRLLLNGGHAASTDKCPTAPSMPDFGWKLSDSQVAALASCVRSAWGNKGASVSAGDATCASKSRTFRIRTDREQGPACLYRADFAGATSASELSGIIACRE